MARSYKLGNTGVSSLIRSANAAQQQQLAYTDEQMSYNWEFSPQDQQSYDEYAKYIQKRIGTLEGRGDTSSLEKALSFRKTQYTVDRQFRTSQIRQANLGIQTGNYTESQKAEMLKNLAMQAYQEGDYTNGDSIQSQYNSLVIKMQNEAITAGEAARSHAAAQSSADYSQVTANSAYLKRLSNELETSFKTQTRPVLDANGNETGQRQPFTMSITQYAQQKNLLQKGLVNTITAALQNPNISDDNKATLQNSLDSAQNSKDAKLFNDNNLALMSDAKAMKQFGSPIYRDANGDVQESAVKAQAVVNGQLRPIYATGQDGKQVTAAIKAGETGASATTTGNGVLNKDNGVLTIPQRNLQGANAAAQQTQQNQYQTQLPTPAEAAKGITTIHFQTMPNGQIRKIATFADGAQAVYENAKGKNDPSSTLVPTEGSNPFQTDKQRKNSLQSAEFGSILGNAEKNAKNDLGVFGNAAEDVFHRVGNFFGGGHQASGPMRAIDALVGGSSAMSQYTGAVKQGQAARSQAQAAAIAQQQAIQHQLQVAAAASQAQLAARQAASRQTAMVSPTANYAANMPSASSIYYNNPYLSPSQKMAQVQSTYADPHSTQAVAAGIGAAVGYNPKAF